MKVQGLIGSMIGLVAGCGVAGTGAEDASGVQVDQVEMASDGLPYFISGDLGRVSAPIDDLARAPEALASLLPSIANALGVPAANLIAKSTERDALGMTHVRLAQQKNGLRVVGGDAIVHLDADGTVRSVNSTVRDADLPSEPSVGAEKAAESAVAATAELSDATRGELTYLVSNTDGELYLAWEIAVRGRDNMLANALVYVDALSGRVIERHPQVFTIKNRVIRNGGGGEFPVTNAPVIGTETAPPTDPVALAAHTNTGITYDCYKDLYNRDSYNNAGATLTSQVHVVFGGSGNNAVWASDVQMMAYGDGDGVQMKQLAYSMDVTAHELTHAVTSATANLVYQNESGALNEGMSDIFGAVCETWKTDKTLANVTAATWLVGEDIWTPNTPGDALRYMANPTKDRVGTSEFYSRDFYAERYTGTQDGGGVHLNSGLPNLTFYLMSVGGTHPRAKTTVRVPSLGIKKSGAIFQRALTNYMTANTNMAAARTATESAAQDLFPGTCAKTTTSLAWAAIGVGTAPTDATAPTTAITSPATGAKVTAGFQVQATASDNLCVDKVELVVDGTVVETLTAAPYTFSAAATNNLTKGEHTIEVKTYDAFQSASARATVNVTGGGTGGGGGNGTGGGDGGVNDGTDVQGGCSTSGNGAAGSLAMMFAAVFALRRRRARR